ncbi:hypothetical protein MST22_15855 [Virgibacillus halodenitrificans]|uniref:hypothetical protein n=1 Tax=Virgibacillus halodenitrificans TaxID=1482 RepID=UPI001FB21CD0|nr:hypothetical protein [Virgibacillus halodenitrificans]MCJ0932623.1 hypothetical protein [Virgibacillus halodenitrificans]
MANLNFRKEATYEFNYDGQTYLDFNYVDNIEGRRYRSAYDDVANGAPIPLFFEGTNSDHAIIKAELVGEREVPDNYAIKKADLLYYLPDISVYALLQYSYQTYGDTHEAYWTIKYLKQLKGVA